MEINRLKPGQILYDVSKERMGNTTLRTTSVRTVRIGFIHPDFTSFSASWNSNQERTYRSVPASWKIKKPYLVNSMMGSQRLATKEEKSTSDIQERSTYFQVSKKA